MTKLLLVFIYGVYLYTTFLVGPATINTICTPILFYCLNPAVYTIAEVLKCTCWRNCCFRIAQRMVTKCVAIESHDLCWLAIIANKSLSLAMYQESREQGIQSCDSPPWNHGAVVSAAKLQLQGLCYCLSIHVTMVVTAVCFQHYL